MRHPIVLVTTSLVCAATVIAAKPADIPSDAMRSSQRIERVGGDLDIRVTQDDAGYRCRESVVETSLPQGYPAPTPPGAIDLKRYPVIRRAEVTGRRAPDRGRNGAFFSLFRHIQRRDIAMTSPVEMDYPGWSGDASNSPESWTMSFVYRTPDDGPIEQAGNVRVVDTTPITVVSIGLRGKYGRATEDRGLQQLAAWLDSQDEWEQAGSPRALYYNGPSIRDSRKWAEVQIPVRRVGTAKPPEDPASVIEASHAGEEAGAILRGNFRAGDPDR